MKWCSHVVYRSKCFVDFIGGVQEVPWFWDPCRAKRPHKVFGQSIQGGCVPPHLPQRQGDSACLPFSGQISQQVKMDLKKEEDKDCVEFIVKFFFFFFCLCTPKQPYYKCFLNGNWVYYGWRLFKNHSCEYQMPALFVPAIFSI